MRIRNADTWTLIEADCVAVLKRFPDGRFDSIVCDPPYELGFMGKKWDATGIAYSVELWREVLRVLKPGGHLLAFGGTRTYHRMACAIEDAGFEVRDSLHWIYGTGFPKSLNVSKAIDEAAGATREVTPTSARQRGQCGEMHAAPRCLSCGLTRNGTSCKCPPDSGPATEAAKQWDGWGTALKPAHEPIVMARKPLTGTVAANVQEWGTGALNIDGCRIGLKEGDQKGEGGRWDAGIPSASQIYGAGKTSGSCDGSVGRWPANVLFDEDAARELDAQSGTSKSTKLNTVQRARDPQSKGAEKSRVRVDEGYADTGGASRFFYVAKPSRKERDLGCDALPAKTGGEATDREDDSIGTQNPRAGAGRTGGARNYHPTVKPIELMRYLVRLVTPTGGTVLDPFLGSGTTGMAALMEGFKFVGIEKTPEYFTIAEARIGGAK